MNVNTRSYVSVEANRRLRQRHIDRHQLDRVTLE